MKKETRPRPKPPTQFEQIPVAIVKQLAAVTAPPMPGQTRQPAAGANFIIPPAVKGAKRDR